MKIAFSPRNRRVLLRSSLPFVVVMCFVIAGLIILESDAATPTASMQPENGIHTNGARAVADTLASGGRATRFSDRPSGTLSPASGAYLGMFSNSDGTGIDNLEARMGRKFDINNHFTDFDGPISGLLGHLADNKEAVDDIRDGRIPLMTWQMQRYGKDDYLPGEINSGALDGYIRSTANRVKELQKPIMIRLGHEMNGFWYPWSACTKTACEPTSASSYVASWKRIHRLFSEQGATNAIWVWCVSGIDVPANVPGHHWTDYYPGDDYVDWVAIDQYAHTKTSTLSTLLEKNSPYKDYAGRKPIMIAETMSGPEPTASDQYDDKSVYFNTMIASLKTDYPNIQALVLFDALGTGDYRINTSTQGMNAFIEMSNNCYLDPTKKLKNCIE